MKNIVLSLFILVAFGTTSCNKAADVDLTLDPKDNPLKEHTQDLQQAKMWLPGKWKLMKVSAMIPNPAVPNVELVVGENQISVIQDNVQIDQVDYELVKINYDL